MPWPASKNGHSEIGPSFWVYQEITAQQEEKGISLEAADAIGLAAAAPRRRRREMR